MEPILIEITGVIQEIRLLKDTYGNTEGKREYKLSLVRVLAGTEELELTTFNEAISERFSEEDKVDITFEEKGNFKTIKTIRMFQEGTKELYEKLIGDDILKNKNIIENLSNSLNQAFNEKVVNMINLGLFVSDFELKDRMYEITIKEK